MEKFDRLKELLRTMFQLDRGDLDFGLYRIMNLKAKEIEDFLDHDLLPQVQSALAGNAAETLAELEEELAEARKGARYLKVDLETTEKFTELQQLLAEARADVTAETDVYNHLANFFARYYDEGDFMSLRRYSGGGQSSYLIPYDGEEVKLHWANSDQYYIKTTENYASYVFTVGTGSEKRRVRFEIARADNEKDNVKETNDKQRRFLLAEGGDEETIEIVDSDLVVRFAHRPLTENEKKTWKGNGNKQQELIDKAAAQRILNSLEPAWQVLLAVAAPTENNPERTVLDKHLAAYTAKNSFDYFIHKDLGGFLRRELDLYLKTDVLNLDDLAAGDTLRLQRALARTRAVRQVADKIITFLAQLEDFQKQLWLKKKFVLETQYCITLDRVPETLYPEIAANKAQHDEWLELFAIDEIEGDLANGNTGYTNPLTVDFLNSNSHLVLDTRHFAREFTDRLLEAISGTGSLDDQLDGLLINAENFQALSLLKSRYYNQIKCIYIDPPYNTDSSAIIYKNDYKDSTWLSLMENRISSSIDLLSRAGVLCCAIDDEEAWRLRAMLQKLFDYEIGIASVRSNPVSRKSTGKLSPSHEYAFFFGKTIESIPGYLEKTEKQLKRYPYKDAKSPFAWLNFIRSGTGDRRADRPHQFYPIYIGDDDSIRIPKMEWDEDNRKYNVLEEPKLNESVLWPIREQEGEIIEKRWQRGWQRVVEDPSEYRVRRDDENISVDFKVRLDETAPPSTWWVNKEYASSNYGAKELKKLFGNNEFEFAKAPRLVEDCLRTAGGSQDYSCILDYFAGSGTTGQAVIKLNREDNGERKYILVEVGRYFDTILLPRIKKIIYTPDWKDGKPVSRNGSTQFFKYIRLESYEDSLDSLKLIPPDSSQQDLLAQNPALEEDYRLRYALGEETASSACLLGKYFTDPFVYTLSVVRDGVRGDVPVDLPETFNFLIGLRSEAWRKVEDVLMITGTDAEGQKCLIIWRNLDGTNNPELDAWFTRNRDSFGEPDIIYANGDHTLNALKQSNESWTAKSIEAVFRELMFKE